MWNSPSASLDRIRAEKDQAKREAMATELINHATQQFLGSLSTICQAVDFKVMSAVVIDKPNGECSVTAAVGYNVIENPMNANRVLAEMHRRGIAYTRATIAAIAPQSDRPVQS
ncbi:MAG: hypothetical protein A2760_01175 [Candidatus Doudnabacteria bacterium RIFCSPHIGHO2_01_FULL_50_67]|uniref:Uncharacterized protein n=1 Tax=Candidatus Doudnabacteria bacterium RIFCSPHIGHO2_12_FULL_48_16 TaxID=1817838 RepID=A0A1F5PLD7_9BACT|nr:MAG: hypothetical protein A3B77_00820 [Candidatus Doudnabacteria bacterium RIFCSPHIGHO2_02_FULL_49_24]OGE88789.1 MAG: hypothetical protein A2760_01175 [Candidatus Doudnabacteria bacterium RIFCSPHIGHO2_01_FULL_50_67]OGE90689.1 MAG: hypothetical protein A3E29_00990 [Candidatus Doudnabacteria bacterium RIFCSPHIGHO2_12_FULL_48_16]OGE97020.1 MAG: hypothetical protein A2990_03015 [Candidatus Doudnabacteria bacterium RIFCSPLOWO2_01_FULL_49_40]